MIMPPRLRKVVLTAHVTSSVGWLGAVLCYLALDLVTVGSQDVTTVRSAYVAMDLIVRFAIVPLALSAVLIGVINALGTPWGLFRHYWVLVKLVLTVVATLVLLQESTTVSRLADLAETSADPRTLSSTLPHSVGGLLILLTAAVLSVFKPRGVTRYGWRKQQERRSGQREKAGAAEVVGAVGRAFARRPASPCLSQVLHEHVIAFCSPSGHPGTAASAAALRRSCGSWPGRRFPQVGRRGDVLIPTWWPDRRCRVGQRGWAGPEPPGQITSATARPIRPGRA
jgi:hypothetical protein